MLKELEALCMGIEWVAYGKLFGQFKQNDDLLNI